MSVEFSKSEQVFFDRIVLQLEENKVSPQHLSSADVLKAGQQVIDRDKELFHVACGSDGHELAEQLKTTIAKNVFNKVNKLH